MDKLKYWGEVETVEDYFRLIKKLGVGITLYPEMARQNRSITLHPKKARSCNNCEFNASKGRYSSETYCLLGFKQEDGSNRHNAKPVDICLPCKNNNNTLSYEESGVATIERLRWKISNEWKL